MAKMFYHRYTVKRAGNMKFPFPIDMLRYDGSFPASELDSGKIHRTMDFTRENDTLDIEIELAANTHSTWTPQDARWLSFGWEVVPNSHTKRS